MPDSPSIQDQHCRSHSKFTGSCGTCHQLLQRFVTAMAMERDIYMRAFEFLEAMAGGGKITVNGIPWREAYERLSAIVPDPLPLPPERSRASA